MVGVAVQSIADDIARWITTNPGGGCAQRVPLSAGATRSASKVSGSDVFVSYAAPSAADFARAVAARLRLERPHLRVAMDNIDQRRASAADAEPKLGIASALGAGIVPAACEAAQAVLVALTREALECPLVAREVAACLGGVQDDRQVASRPRLAFIYHVRSGRGQDPFEMMRLHSPPWLRGHAEGPGQGADAVPIFEYLHEYEDLCVSAVLKWLGCTNIPSGMTLARLHSNVVAAAQSLQMQTPQGRKSPVHSPPKTHPDPMRKSSTSILAPSISTAKVTPKCLREFGIGLLHDSSHSSNKIAEEITETCERAFGSDVRVATALGTDEVPCEHIANLLVIVTLGTFQCDAVVKLLTRALRDGGTNILLLQDMRNLPSIWDEFTMLPNTIRPAVASIVAVPYLRSHGFSACLARIAGTPMLSPLVPNTGFKKPVAAQYGRPFNSKFIDLFLCHFQRTGLDWAFVMRLNFVQHAGPSFRVFLDVQSLQHLTASGSYVEQSHALAVLITPGIFTRFFCQRELLVTRKAGVQVIFIQHMRSCIDVEEELDQVRVTPAEFMARHGDDFARAGGTEADFAHFQQVLFEHIWTSRFRPPVFAYVQELEAQCVGEITKYLRNRRARKSGGAEQLRESANAVLGFLRMSPEDREDVRAGLSVVANQACGGSGNDICAAFVHNRAMPVLAEAIQNHASADSNVALQAFRALRSLGGTTSGEAALLQFADTEGAIHALHQALKAHVGGIQSQGALQKEGLKVLRAFCSGGSALQHAVRRAGLWSEFCGLFSHLRSELEPLDEIREMLNIAPVELPRLEFALQKWHQGQSKGGTLLPAEVKEASQLLKSVSDLRAAVASEDGERIEELLGAHRPDVERCCGVEGLLLKAQALSLQFQEQQRLLEQQRRTEEEQEQARRAAQERIERLLADVAEQPTPSQLEELEAAVIAAHQTGCPQGFAERARGALEELRVAFNTPFEFLNAVHRHWQYVKPPNVVQALLAGRADDRTLALRCLSTAAALAEEVTVRRADVEVALRVMESHPADLEMHTAACECLSALLSATSRRHGVVSALALVEDASSGDIAAIKAVVKVIELANDAGPTAEMVSEAACRCLAQIAGLGESAVAEIVRREGTAQSWITLRQLGVSGRQRHTGLVLQIITILENVCRHSSRDRVMDALDTLLKVCDIYDAEGDVCAIALRAISSLFNEKARLTVALVQSQRYYASEADSSPTSRSESCALQILLRNMRMHERHAELQELACQIMEMTLRHLVDSQQGAAISSDRSSSLVVAVFVALRVHMACVGTCTAACACLSCLLDVSADAVCNEIIRQEGVVSLTQIMSLHHSVKRVQVCGLTVLSALALRFPRQIFSEMSIKVLVSAMQSSVECATMQRVGCAALRSAAELGSDVAAQVSHLGSSSVLAAIAAFPGDVSLHKEALTTLSLAAASSPEHGRWLGESCRLVPQVLQAIESLQPEVLACQQAGGPCTSDVIVACLAACRALRDVCGARAMAGISFDKLFHCGVCKSAKTFADLLECSAAFHDLQIEVLQLLSEVVLQDKDGALMVGSMLARSCAGAAGAPSASSVNLVVWVLQRYHTSDDFMVVCDLIARLAVCDAFAASMSSESGSLELLRWTAIFRGDATVQQKALNALEALLGSSLFDAGLLASADGVEVLLLAAARHFNSREVVTTVESALLEIARQCSTRSLYAALQAVLQRQESNVAVVVALGHSLCTIFRKGVGDADALFDSGMMLLLVSACQQHRRERGVGFIMPLVDLSLHGSKMRDCLLQGGAGELLVHIIQGSLTPADARKPAGSQDWLWEVTIASRRAKSTLESSDDISAGLRALRKLLCADHWSSVVTPELTALLSRTMANSSDPSFLEPAAALLADALRLVEEHMTWTACRALSIGPAGISLSQRVAATARSALDAEVRGLALWRSGNFLPAAAEFRHAAAELGSITSPGGSKGVDLKALVEHQKAMPLGEYSKLCEQHQLIILRETATARTTADVSPPEELDDCPICLEPLQGGEGGGVAQHLWTCETCHKHVHEACIRQWQRTKSSCPLCRRALDPATGAGSFHRARAIAEAADDYLKARQGVSGVSSVDNAFLAASVAALWRAALRLGRALQIGNSVLAQAETRAAQLEVISSRACGQLEQASARFEEEFVVPLEKMVMTAKSPSPGAEAAMKVIEAVTAEMLQRRCAALAEEAAMWLADAARMKEQARFSHAEQLLIRSHANLCEIVELAPAARLPTLHTAKQVEHVLDLQREVLAIREAGHRDDSVGHVNAMRPIWPALTPFHGCMKRAWDQPKMAEHVLNAARAIASIGHAARVGINQGQWAGLFRRATEACGSLLDAMFHDRVPSRVVAFLSGAKGRTSAFMGVSFFQQLLRCGQDRQEACFSQVDGIIAAVAAESVEKDPQLRSCLCSLVHELVFQGDSEERMVRRLQREGAPRAAATLQEWFLDTLLVQHGATASRDGIVRASQRVDAWLLYQEGSHASSHLLASG